YSGVTATFTPSTQLDPSTLYTATISTVATSAGGVPLDNNYVWTFMTIVIPPPTVISTDPINNATGVLVNKVVTATFSEAMDPLTINGTSFTLRQGVTTVPGVVTYTGNTASYTPNTDLTSGTVYTATITTAARSSANGIALANNYVWTFTTLVIPPPVVISTIPTNGATNVPLIQVVSADFSVPMDPLTINTSTFTLRKGVTVVPGVVGYSGTTATFTPNAYLESDETYTATITTGARSDQNIALANNYVWTFNTVPHLGPPPVDLASADAYGILAGVGISNNAGFSEIHDMNVGISPGVRSSVTGFPPAVVINGAIYCSDDVAPPGIAALLIQAKQDLTNAYLAAEGASNPAPVTVSGDIGGTTLAPGIYKSTSTLMIQSGDLTLDAQGDVNATWIFQVSSAFTTVGGAGGSVILSGGAQAKNVFWQTGSSATIGDFTIFKGNVLALTSVTMNSDAVAQGRMLARNGAVVMTSTNIITKP
ncbi:MAG TPA: ice-binding family protein, partial [Bacteroidia bacterium]|nr:ice-binding family protein [Bacteroidia bacterium]